MRRLACLLAALASSSPAQGPTAVALARRRVEGALIALNASQRPASTIEQALRAEATVRAAHRILGGYDVLETHEILERMFLWLAGPEGRAAAVLMPDRVLERAARAAHPSITDGPGERGAANWAAFVRLIAAAP